MKRPDYDRIGRGYSEHRRPDPRIAAQIEEALGSAQSIVNVGSGAGSYEPSGREVVAVEPSAEMIAQRPAGSADAPGRARPRPPPQRRSEPRPPLLADQGHLPGFLNLIPEQYRSPGYWSEELRQLWGEVEVLPVPAPHDCPDGFYQSYWRRPHAYLDPRIRNSTSVFHRLPGGGGRRGNGPPPA
jgi:hypothetical protein